MAFYFNLLKDRSSTFSNDLTGTKIVIQRNPASLKIRQLKLLQNSRFVPQDNAIEHSSKVKCRHKFSSFRILSNFFSLLTELSSFNKKI